MKNRPLIFSFSILVLILIAGLYSCSGGGGSSSAPPEPPAYNVTGTWNVTETIGYNTGGVPNGTKMYATYIANQQQGSNTVSIRDTRDSDTQNATLSGSSFSYSGPRHPEFGCTSMTATYNMTVTGSGGIGTSMSGTGRATCLDDGSYGETTLVATKQP